MRELIEDVPQGIWCKAAGFVEEDMVVEVRYLIGRCESQHESGRRRDVGDENFVRKGTVKKKNRTIK